MNAESATSNPKPKLADGVGMIAAYNCLMGMRKILFGWLLAGVVITASATDHPYQGIVARNVFGLKDPPPPPNPEDNKPPPPKILLRGIANVVGKKQVLFDVEKPVQPGQPAGRNSLILGVGEAQDDIEVLEIVEATGSVKFRNHGVEEVRTFEKDAAKPVATALPIPGMAPGNTTAIAPRPAVPTPGLQTIPTRPSKGAGTDSPIPPPPPGAP